MTREELKKRAIIELKCLPEDISIEGNVLASGDDEEDRKAEEEVRRQLKDGNEWAWCCAHVRVSFESLQADDYLGGCSYLSEEDFRAGGYYEDMVNSCLDEILSQIEKIKALYLSLPFPPVALEFPSTGGFLISFQEHSMKNLSFLLLAFSLFLLLSSCFWEPPLENQSSVSVYVLDGPSPIPEGFPPPPLEE